MLDLDVALSVSTRLCAGIRGVFGVMDGVCGLFVRIKYLKADLRLRLILGCPHQNLTNQSRSFLAQDNICSRTRALSLSCIGLKPCPS